MKTDTPRTNNATLRAFDIEGVGEFDAVHVQVSSRLERELTAVTEQRDRLAEALKRIVTIYENPEKGCIPSSSDMYDEALQSLTTNAEL